MTAVASTLGPFTIGTLPYSAPVTVATDPYQCPYQINVSFSGSFGTSADTQRMEAGPACYSRPVRLVSSSHLHRI